MILTDPEYRRICKMLPPRNIEDYEVGDFYEAYRKINMVTKRFKPTIGFTSPYHMFVETVAYVDGGWLDNCHVLIDEEGPDPNKTWLPHCVSQWMQMKEWPTNPHWYLGHEEDTDQWAIYYESDCDCSSDCYGCNINSVLRESDPLLACARAVEPRLQRK